MSIRLPASIRSGLPYLLSRAYRRQMTLFEKHTASFDISGREYAVMLLLEAHERPWQSQIADALGLDRTTVTYLVDALEAKGRAARHRDTQDRRAYVVSLTAAGQKTLADIGPAVERARDEILSALDADEQAQLGALLARLCGEPD